MTGFLLNLARRSAGVTAEHVDAVAAPRSGSELPTSLPDTVPGASSATSGASRRETLDTDTFGTLSTDREGGRLDTAQQPPSGSGPTTAAGPLPVRDDGTSDPDATGRGAAARTAPAAPATPHRQVGATPASGGASAPFGAPSAPRDHHPPSPLPEPGQDARHRHSDRGREQAGTTPRRGPTAQGHPLDPSSAAGDDDGTSADAPAASAPAAPAPSTVPASDQRAPESHGTPAGHAMPGNLDAPGGRGIPIAPPLVTPRHTSLARAPDAPAPGRDTAATRGSPTTGLAAPPPAEVRIPSTPAPVGLPELPAETRPGSGPGTGAVAPPGARAWSATGDGIPTGRPPDALATFETGPTPPRPSVPGRAPATRSVPSARTPGHSGEPVPPPSTPATPAAPTTASAPSAPSAPLLTPPLPSDRRDPLSPTGNDPAPAIGPLTAPATEPFGPRRSPGRAQPGAETTRSGEQRLADVAVRAQPDRRAAALDLPAARRAEPSRSVQIRIGTVEVRGAASAPPPQPQSQPPRTPRGFDAYRRVRTHER